ncbi:hypothetical protein ACGFZB_39045 [Streptomyces cinerochromogenes]|uniref:Uncharacterized protein n=1 Tax=Streptomyces cinerochromogenes TaxID=66422 RepID=A0ABW7BGL6_9ACTN
MSARRRVYRYGGPAELRPDAGTGPDVNRVGSAAEFEAWAAARPAAELDEPFTYVVGTDGALRLAPRRSEHVACAGGDAVRSAGEITFARRAGHWTVTDVSNHSTGYCPDVTSWPAVAEALERAGLAHPGGFTHAVVFRRCPACQERGIVHEGEFVCVFCGGELPEAWNVEPPGYGRLP